MWGAKKSVQMVEVLHDMGNVLSSVEDYIQSSDSVFVANDKEASPAPKIFWGWEEDESYVNHHNPSLKSGNFIGYSELESKSLEDAYQHWKQDDTVSVANLKVVGQKVRNSHTGILYHIDFQEMIQTNAQTGFLRSIRREVHFTSAACTVPSGRLPDLPYFWRNGTIRAPGTSFLPIFKGQLIQLSEITKDEEWARGTVAVGHDQGRSGWFPYCLCKKAGIMALRNALTKGKVYGFPPSWEAGMEGLVKVPVISSEYKDVTRFFLSSIDDGVNVRSTDDVTIVNVERIQSKSLWMLYATKSEEMKARYEKGCQKMINNNGKHGFERKWLFHGTDSSSAAKIAAHGFNRSFANLTAYGKGVYFAVNSSYSCSPNYAKPDAQRVQRVFLCRVMVGDWCEGTSTQHVPDEKLGSNSERFDSTVNDMLHPPIFVTYHDAQAYPEYLLSFKLK